MSFVPIKPRGPSKAAKKCTGGPTPRWGLAQMGLLCVLLVLGALVPYDRFATRPPIDFAAIEQMTTDAPVATVDDLMRTYRLPDSARPYLRVDEARIYFDPQLSQAPE